MMCVQGPDRKVNEFRIFNLGVAYSRFLRVGALKGFLHPSVHVFDLLCLRHFTHQPSPRGKNPGK